MNLLVIMTSAREAFEVHDPDFRGSGDKQEVSVVVPYLSSFRVQGGASMAGTATSIITAAIGLGVTTMPAVWERGGLIVSWFVLMFATVVAGLSSQMNNYNADLSGGSEDTVQMGQVVGGVPMACVAGVFATLHLLGSAATYIKLLPAQITSALDAAEVTVPYLSGKTQYEKDVSMLVVAILMFPPMVYFRNMGDLVVFSMTGVAMVCIFLTATLVGLMVNDKFILGNSTVIPAEDNNGIAPNSIEAYGYYEVQYVGKEIWGYGKILNKLAFSYASALLIPTFKKDMARPREMTQSIIIAHITIFVAYTLISVFALLRVGGGIKCSSMIMNLVPGWYRVIAASGVVVNLYVSTPLYTIPVAQMMERVTGIIYLPKAAAFGASAVVRFLILFVSFLFSYSVDGVVEIIDLTAAVSMTTNCSFLPVFFYVILSRRHGNQIPGYMKAAIPLTLLYFVSIFGLGGYIALWPFLKKNDTLAKTLPSYGYPGCVPNRGWCAEYGCYD